MSRPSDARQPDPADVLFVRRDAEELRFLPAESRAAAAALAQLELHVDDVRAVVAEPDHACFAPGLFIGHAAKDNVALQGHAFALEHEERHELHHATALHVDSTASVDSPILDHALERRHVPVLRLHGHDVGVVAQHQWPLAAIALERRHHDFAVRRGFDVLALNALAFDERTKKAGGWLLIAGRVGSIDL